MQNSIMFLKKYLISNIPVVIGCSGGPDSMFLLNLIKQNFKDVKIICAHVNHNIRKESKQEALFVKQYCQENNIIYETITLEKKKQVNEADLRERRYEFFRDILHKYQSKILLTAHHGDDLVETILMRITRGSTIKGYAGIELCRTEKDILVLRPLLYFTKEEILKYNNKNNIPYVIDKSNEDEKYTRNRYRKQMLPFLKKENKDINLKYLQLSEELLEYYHFVDDIVLEEVNKNFVNETYNLIGFKSLNSLLKRKIIEKIVGYYYQDNIYLITNKHIKEILNIIDNKSNGVISLPLNMKIIKKYDKLEFAKESKIDEKEFDYIFNKYLELDTGILKETKEDNDNSNYCIKLNSKEIILPLHIRTRKDGDKIKIKNLNGYKKVKDILIDEKVDIEKRKKIIIVTDSANNIIWIPGLKKSQFDKSKSKNYDIIIKYTSKDV